MYSATEIRQSKNHQQYKSVDLLPNCIQRQESIPRQDSMVNAKFDSISDIQSIKSPKIETQMLLRNNMNASQMAAKQIVSSNKSRPMNVNPGINLNQQKKSTGMIVNTNSMTKIRNQSKSNHELSQINDQLTNMNNQQIILEKLRQMNLKREITNKQQEKIAAQLHQQATQHPKSQVLTAQVNPKVGVLKQQSISINNKAN